MTKAHRFFDTQPTTSPALLRIQLRIAPMIPGNASGAFAPNLPSKLNKAFSFFLIHSFNPFSSLGGSLPPAEEALHAPPPPGSKTSIKTPIAIPIALSMEAIIIPCSWKSVLIFSANETSLSKTLAVVSLMLVI